MMRHDFFSVLCNFSIVRHLRLIKPEFDLILEVLAPLASDSVSRLPVLGRFVRHTFHIMFLFYLYDWFPCCHLKQYVTDGDFASGLLIVGCVA